MIPATIFAPFASVLGDRYRPARVLTLGYFIQATAMGATAAVLLLDGPAALAYACAAVAATATTMTRPTMAAPAIVGRVILVAVAATAAQATRERSGAVEQEHRRRGAHRGRLDEVAQREHARGR